MTHLVGGTHDEQSSDFKVKEEPYYETEPHFNVILRMLGKF